MTADLGVPAHARPAWDAMHELIARTGPTPCVGADRDLWIGTAQQQQAAAVRCLDCPAMTLCAAYALTARERDGTWGGRTAAERTTTPGPPRAKAHTRKEPTP